MLATRRFMKLLGPDRRLVIYLWPSGYRLEHGQPVWIGEVTLQQRHRWSALLVYPRSRPAGAKELSLLKRDLQSGPLLLRLAREGTLIQLADPAAAP
jgi:hypothetical protein